MYTHIFINYYEYTSIIRIISTIITETMLAETMHHKEQHCDAAEWLSGTFLVAQPVHLCQHTRAACARTNICQHGFCQHGFCQHGFCQHGCCQHGFCQRGFHAPDLLVPRDQLELGQLLHELDVEVHLQLDEGGRAVLRTFLLCSILMFKTCILFVCFGLCCLFVLCCIVCYFTCCLRLLCLFP